MFLRVGSSSAVVRRYRPHMGSILNWILRPIQRFPQRLKSVGISYGHSGQTLRFRTCASGTLEAGLGAAAFSVRDDPGTRLVITEEKEIAA
jgi:hypothetical protein